MNEKPHVWLIYVFTAPHKDGSVSKGNATLITTKTGLELMQEAEACLKNRYPDEGKIIIGNMSDLGEHTRPVESGHPSVAVLLDRLYDTLRDKAVRAFEHLDTEPIHGTNRNRFITAETPEEMVRLDDVREAIAELRESNPQ